jgi:hypothetical protein
MVIETVELFITRLEAELAGVGATLDRIEAEFEDLRQRVDRRP